MNRQEQITISCPAGTRARLKSIENEFGATKEDIFKLGLHFLFKKLDWDKQRAEQAAKPKGLFSRFFNRFTKK
ncbi:MAG: hypothetical protein WCK57_07595 [Verrucomicrobiae bacterium]